MGALTIMIFVVLTSAMLGVATITLVWMLDAWRTPDAADGTSFARDCEPHLSFSLLVPARHEEAVLADTLERLASLDHPYFEVLAIVGHDDPDTAAVARHAARQHRDKVRVVVDNNWPKNKPKALNTALPECRGDIVGVFDAEDEVAMGLLRRVDACFRDPEVSVVQGGVQLMNFQSSWWSLHNVLEYFFWFRSRLHRHARQEAIPLGGNTVFFRRDVLESVDGWDDNCLAEDCEVGIRLSAMGHRVAVAYEPDLVTREETPDGIGALLKQRTRWNQGFLEVLAKGEWRHLPHRAQRVRTWYMLVTPMLQACTAVLIPVSLLAAFKVHAPDPLALFMFAPLAAICVTLAVEAAGLHEFGRMYGQRVRVRDYVKLVLGIFPYQWLLSVAAVRAAVRHLRRDTSWEKTAHVGAHRRGDLALVSGRPARVGPAIDTADAAAPDEVEEEVAS
jgi:cellulose synthase/poly-beta-1,6-N-acetylglucosamine synthase-like glycosyltransferase